jgi:hypothetical protein
MKSLLRAVAIGAAFTSLCSIGSRANAQAIQACEQSIQYSVTPPSGDVPKEVSVFSGVWVGNWANQLCSVLVVEKVDKDGVASGKYAWGTNNAWSIKQPGIRPWSGRIADGALILRGKRDWGSDTAAEFHPVNGNALAGVYTVQGQYQGTFVRR